jgi:hypothetical protein
MNVANLRHAPALIPHVFAISILGVCQASAGMTVVTLTDIARARLDALSFFLVSYLAICWAVKLLWNYLGKTFTVLPRLNYTRALGLVFLSGMMFYVVLTMISGARELLTPGAWEKQGIGYRTRDGQVATLTKDDRRSNLRKLQEAIWAYAKDHEGQAPPGPLVAGIEPELWRFPGGGLYCLMPDVRPGGGREVLVYEPSTAGGRRFILLADGNIEDRDEGVLKRDLERQFPR